MTISSLRNQFIQYGIIDQHRRTASRRLDSPQLSKLAPVNSSGRAFSPVDAKASHHVHSTRRSNVFCISIIMNGYLTASRAAVLWKHSGETCGYAFIYLRYCANAQPSRPSYVTGKNPLTALPVTETRPPAGMTARMVSEVLGPLRKLRFSWTAI